MSNVVNEGSGRQVFAAGEILPEVTLKDGTKAHTGTVATALYNVALYNEGQRGQVEKDLESAVPILLKVGMFQLFSPEEWIAGINLGRAFLGKAAMKLIEKEKN